MTTAKVRAGGAATAMAVLLAACGAAPTGGAGAGSPVTGTRPGQLAPPLAGVSLRGHRLSLEAWRGSVVVLVFWASWCVPCQAEQPALDALAEREMPSGVRFAGISVDVDPVAARSYLARLRVPYDSLVDTAQTIAVAFDVSGPPTTYVVDRRGRVTAELVGALNVDQLRAVISAAAA